MPLKQALSSRGFFSPDTAVGKSEKAGRPERERGATTAFAYSFLEVSSGSFLLRYYCSQNNF